MTKPRGRDGQGRFIKGNPGSPGRLPRKLEENYLKVTMREVSVEQWGKIVAKAAQQAIGGDARAREWLARYLIGDPTQFHQYLFESHQEVRVTVEFEAPRLGAVPLGTVIDGEIQYLDGDDGSDPAQEAAS